MDRLSKRNWVPYLTRVAFVLRSIEAHPIFPDFIERLTTDRKRLTTRKARQSARVVCSCLENQFPSADLKREGRERTIRNIRFV